MKIDNTQHCDGTLAARFAALGHPARLAILRWLAVHDTCQCKDVVDSLPLAQSTVSQHLKTLVNAGLVDADISRPGSRYRLNREGLEELGQVMGVLVDNCCRPGDCTDNLTYVIKQKGGERAC